MGLYDDLLEEQPKIAPKSNIKNSSGLYDDLFIEEPKQNVQPQSFKEAHPFVSSLPEAGKQLGLRAVKSYPEFAKGLNDLTALIGDKTNWKGLANWSRDNADFWQEQSDKIKIDPRYQGLNGLKSKETFIPTVMGEVGGQATNLLMAMGGGAMGGAASKAAGLKTLGQAAAVTTGSALPNLAQEGEYLEKIEDFKKIYGREPNSTELKNIQNVALGEKGINTALETLSDRLLFGKLFPNGTVPKGLINKTKKLGKDILEQTVTEAGTEGMQESVSVGAEKLLGINQGSWQENLSRIGEASALGGLTGGVLGGVTSAASRDYNTQFPDNNNNAIKADTIDNSKQQETSQLLKKAIKEVSAQLYNGGKELYNSAANGINNAVTDINNTINQPAAFDVLRELSQNGDLQNQLQTVAPNTMQKIQEEINNSSDMSVEDTSLPNLMTDNENLYNLTNNGKSEITNQNEVKEVAKESHETTKNEVNEKPIKKKIQKIAPDTNKIQENNEHQFIEDKPEGWGDKRYNLTDKNNKRLGYIEYSNRDDNSVTIDYVHNESGKDRTGIGTKLVDKVLSENPDKIILWDAVKDKNAQAFKESYTNKHPELKDRIYEQGDYKQLVALAHSYGYNNPIEFRDFLNARNNIATGNGRSTNNILERSGQWNEYSGSDKRIVESNAATETTNRRTNQPNIRTKRNQTQKSSETTTKLIKTFAPNTAENIDIQKLKQDIIDLGFNADDVNNLIDRMANNQPLGSTNMYKFGVTIGQRLYQNNKHHDYEKLKKQYLKNISNKKQGIEKTSENENNNTKEDIKNGHVEVVNGNRPELQEKQEETSSTARGISQETSSDDGLVDGIRRENNISDERGIVETDKEIISKQYKNQHELNLAIEKFINDKEYEKYNGNLPQELKEWLKKYTGAGGLEKQGAEGKGLLSEYYTPQNIVNKMWDLTKQYINTDGAKVLEPSCGIGRFLEQAPENTSFDVFEMNPISAKITKILYPDTNVTTGEFQEKFINKANNTPVKSVTPEYDIIIGNPPYGAYSGRYKGMGEGKSIARLEHYFIKRGLDTLKENGVMTFIIPSSFLNGEITNVKQEISRNANC